MTRTADRLISNIKKDISSGMLEPGDSLEESTLAEKFGVSRTPIREAIRTLVDFGILETRSRKGAIVRVLSAKELIDLFEVAAELEGMACRLAAFNITNEHVESIHLGLQSCREAAANKDITGYSLANIKVHQAIHNASGNDFLIKQLEQIQIRINSYRNIPYTVHGRIETSTIEHAEICNAILSGNGNIACELMKNHIMLQGQRIPSIISSIEKFNK